MALAPLAGCGSDPLDADTRSLPANVTVSAHVYLNDSAEAVGAIVAFVDLVNTTPELTPQAARRLAPDLARDAERMCALRQRLAAQRLADRRLEQQRSALQEPLGDACDAMRSVAAAAGLTTPDVKGMVSRLRDLRVALAAIRTAGGG